MSIIVTGASGFVGNAVVRELVKRGHEVISVGRTMPAGAQEAANDLGLKNTRKRPGLWHLNWDITEPAPAHIASRAANAQAVIHTAARMDDWMTSTTAHAVNVTGTRNVLDAFPNSRVVYFSCASVYDPQEDWNSTYEEAALVTKGRYTSELERSLVGAEAVVNRVRPSAVLLRPGPIYGPGDTRNLPYLMNMATKGVLALPGGGDNLITLCHIDNAVAAALAALARPHVSGPINIGDPEPYILRHAINTLLARTDEYDIVSFETIAPDLAQMRAWWWERKAKAKGGPARIEKAQASGNPKAVRKANAAARPAMTRFAVRQFIHDRTLNLTRQATLLQLDAVPGLAPRES